MKVEVIFSHPIASYLGEEEIKIFITKSKTCNIQLSDMIEINFKIYIIFLK